MDRGHHGEGMQQRPVVGTPRGMAGHRERTHRHAVIADVATEDLDLLRLAALPPVPDSRPNGELGRLGAAAHEERMVQVAGSQCGQPAGELLSGLIGELRPIGEGDTRELTIEGVGDLQDAVADAGGHRAAGSVKVPTSLGVVEEDTLAVTDGRIARSTCCFRSALTGSQLRGRPQHAARR